MKSVCYAITLLVIFGGKTLAQKAEMFYNHNIEVDMNNVPVNGNQYYFPLVFFPETEIQYIQEDSVHWVIIPKIITGTQDTFMVQWYSRHLYALMEPLLFNRRFREKEIYRFTWLRTFHNPIVIRIERNPDGVMLFWKKSDGMGGYEPGKIVVDESKSLNEDHWQQFICLVQRANFWDLHYGRFSYGTDGSEWILEGVDPDKYRVITVWYPRKGYFYEACKYLLSLTGMNIPEKDIY